jgi:hypothetical protein
MKIGKTRLPLPTDEYERQWGDQLIRAIDQNLDAVAANIDSSTSATGFYGSFYDTTTQNAVAANTAYAMKLNTTAESNQIAVTNTSRVTFKNRGTYNIQFSAQIDQSSGSPHKVYIWLRKNGTDVPNSASLFTIQGSNTELVAAWNFIVTVLAGEYVEIMWAVEDTSVYLAAFAATAFSPAIPSVILTAVSI